MGHGFHPDLTGDIGVVHEVLGEAAVVEAHELLEHQARQQLGLGKLLGAELNGIKGRCKSFPSNGLRLSCARQFGHHIDI